MNTLFSITNSGSHKVVNFLGLKFKILPKAYKDLRKTVECYRKKQFDIKTLPKATGRMRQFQLSNLTLLLFLDKICRENNISYWLDFGTLLGAVRHKGFIPWDDDVDVSMMREDYEKIFDLVNNNSYNSDIYAEYHKHPKYVGRWFFIKILHKKNPHVFVDIFPYDYYGEKLSHEQQLNLTQEIITKREFLWKQCTSNMTNEKIKADIDNFRNELLKNNNIKDTTSDLIWGIDYAHTWKQMIHSYDTIFPLKDIEFEGKHFKCINNPDKYLTDVYGDYKGYPMGKIRVHNIYMDMTDEEVECIDELVEASGVNI